MFLDRGRSVIGGISARATGDAASHVALRGAAGRHRRFGDRHLHVILRRDGHVLNRKRTLRICREEGLPARRRRSRKRALGTRASPVAETMANARWSVDFIQDRCADGRPFRILNVIDDVTAVLGITVHTERGFHPHG
ncbi:MAG: transposase [Rhodobacteraceae bacterium]|nr:transposase [Paracoccaceae bacterium]